MEPISCGAILDLRALGAKPCQINLIATADNCLCTTYAYLRQKDMRFNLYTDIQWQDDFAPPEELKTSSHNNISCLVIFFYFLFISMGITREKGQGGYCLLSPSIYIFRILFTK